jgi:hypothetical protein
MFQGAAAAAYYSTPVYGHSHYKKFWLKKMESEDDPPAAAPPESGVLLRNKPAYAVNCSPLELRGSCSPPSSSSVRMCGVKTVTENNNIKKKARCPPEKSSHHKCELDYTLAIGVGVGMSGASSEENKDVSDGFYDDKFHKFMVPASNSTGHEDAQPFNPINNNSPRAVTRVCTDCKTVKTPLWRNGPQGPKSLCNACGIRYKKLGKRPIGNLERPSSPPTPPISPSAKQIIKLSKRKREGEAGKTKQQLEDAAATTAAAVSQHHPRKRIKTTSVMEKLAGGRSDRVAMGPGSLSLSSPSRSQSEAPDSPRLEQSEGGYYAEERNRNGSGRGEALRRWREVERIKRGLLRYGKIRSLAKDEEEGAVLLMALSCGVASC